MHQRHLVWTRTFKRIELEFIIKKKLLTTQHILYNASNQAQRQKRIRTF
jgi:hypothetical protein